MLSPTQTLLSNFEKINRARLGRTLASLSEPQRVVMSMLPLIFHDNNPALPGYVENPGPTGLRDLRVSKEQASKIRRFCPKFEYKPSALPKYQLSSLFLMGSSGSIAFNSKSDFDIWICVSPSVAPAEIEFLRQRTLLIEHWAATFKLELHFFVLAKEKFIDNPVEQLSTENSGSTQRYLLLDEFYRTAILLSGLPPAWWVVPSDQEVNYDQYVRDQREAGPLSPAEYVDFGGLSNIPAEEFLGAALWQLFKGIHSPHKSILKILLLEIYACDYPKIELLSNDYKRNIEQGVWDLDELDPYLLMYRKIEDYLKKRDEFSVLELVRRCFYLKVGEKLSRSYRTGTVRMQRRIMLEQVKRWGWNAAVLEHLDNHDSWNIEEVLQEHRHIVKKFSSSYLALSNFTRSRGISALVSQQEMDLMGRRLHTALGVEPDKVELIRTHPLPQPEYILTVHCNNPDADQPEWHLFTNAIAGGISKVKPLKRFNSLVQLILWCHFNGILSSRTKVLQTNGALKISSKELDLLHRFLNANLPLETVDKTTLTDIAQPAKPKNLAVLVNLGFEPFNHYKHKGAHVTSDRSDPLAYGMRQVNTIQRLDCLNLNSWGELRVKSFAGDEAVIQCIQHCLSSLNQAGNEELPLPLVFGQDEIRGSLAAIRVKELLHNLIQARKEGSQLLFPLTNRLILAEPKETQTHFHQFSNELALLNFLSVPVPEFRALKIDRYTQVDSPLAPMAKLNKAGSIQVFITGQQEITDIYILDERGSLFLQSTQSYRLRTHLRHVESFLKNSIAGQSPTTNDSGAASLDFYQLNGNEEKGWKCLKVSLAPLKNPQEQFLTVSLKAFKTAKTDFDLHYRGRSWSYQHEGEEIFRSVAGFVQNLRQSNSSYPIYLSELHLPTSENIQTVERLQFKKWLEARLSDHLG